MNTCWALINLGATTIGKLRPWWTILCWSLVTLTKPLCVLSSPFLCVLSPVQKPIPTPYTRTGQVDDLHVIWTVPGVWKSPVLNVGLGVRTQQLQILTLSLKMVLLTDTGQKVGIFTILKFLRNSEIQLLSLRLKFLLQLQNNLVFINPRIGTNLCESLCSLLWNRVV